MIISQITALTWWPGDCLFACGSMILNHYLGAVLERQRGKNRTKL
jgi:hypothetical protein